MPLVPSSGSSPPHAVRAAVSPAQSTTASDAVRWRARTDGTKEVTGALPLSFMAGGGRRQRTRVAYAIGPRAVRTVRRSGPRGYGLA